MSQTDTRVEPYETTRPGDLITSRFMNEIQVRIREDIAARVQEGVEAHQYVDRARNADALEGKTADELRRDVVEALKGLVPGLTGHRVVYKRLHADEPAIIRHELGNYPLVDVYELTRFPVVSSDDGHLWEEEVYWFLYHRTEMKIRKPKDEKSEPGLVTIEESRGPVFKQRFKDVLRLHDVPYDGQTTLGDLVNEFWKKLFSDPNDAFDETTFAHSPWFDRCCGDRRTVESLKRGGEWNDLYLKVVPRRSINSIAPVRPLGLEVMHYDLDTVGLQRADFARLTFDALAGVVDAVNERYKVPGDDSEPSYPDAPVEEIIRALKDGLAEAAGERGLPEVDELFLMVLLKV